MHAKETEKEKREEIRGEERREDHIGQPINHHYHYHHQVQRQRSVAFSRLRATHSKSTTTTTPPPDRSSLSNRKLETCFRPFPLPARRGRTTKQGRNGGYPVLPGLPTSPPPQKKARLGDRRTRTQIESTLLLDSANPGVLPRRLSHSVLWRAAGILYILE